MHEKLKLAMRKLGYRPMNRDVWGKPIGYQLLTISVRGKKVELTNHFKAKSNKLLVFSRHEIKDNAAEGGYEGAIKFAEYTTYRPVSTGYDSDFGFLTLTDQFDALL